MPGVGWVKTDTNYSNLSLLFLPITTEKFHVQIRYGLWFSYKTIPLSVCVGEGGGASN